MTDIVPIRPFDDTERGRRLKPWRTVKRRCAKSISSLFTSSGPGRERLDVAVAGRQRSALHRAGSRVRMRRTRGLGQLKRNAHSKFGY
jgi:hypothetical protein